MKVVQVLCASITDTGLSNPRLRAKVKRATGLGSSRKENDQDWAKGNVTTDEGRRLGDGLAHFGSDQFREVAFNIIACFTSNAGCALGKGMAALMRLENGFLDCQGSLALRTNYRHGLLLNLIRVENSKQLSKSTMNKWTEKSSWRAQQTGCINFLSVPMVRMQIQW